MKIQTEDNFAQVKTNLETLGIMMFMGHYFSMSMFLAGTLAMDVPMPGNDIPAVEPLPAQLFHDRNAAMLSNLAVHTYDDLGFSVRLGVTQVLLDLCANILEVLLN